LFDRRLFSSETPSSVDESSRALHAPELRSLVLERGDWEVRSAPGHCAHGCRWLTLGLWHVQFFQRELELSVLVFGDSAREAKRSRPLEFVLRTPTLPRGASVSADELDAYIDNEAVRAPSAETMRRLTLVLEDKALGSLLLSRAVTQKLRPERVGAA